MRGPGFSLQHSIKKKKNRALLLTEPNAEVRLQPVGQWALTLWVAGRIRQLLCCGVLGGLSWKQRLVLCRVCIIPQPLNKHSCPSDYILLQRK